MSKRTLVGGPMDGQEREVYAELRVALDGREYGWKHACGHWAVAAVGRYDHEGRWKDAERDVTLRDDCSQCDEFGKDAVSMLMGRGR